MLEDGNIRVHPNEAEAFDLEPNQVLSNYVCLKVRKIPAVRTWMHEKNDKYCSRTLKSRSKLRAAIGLRANNLTNLTNSNLIKPKLPNLT